MSGIIRKIWSVLFPFYTPFFKTEIKIIGNVCAVKWHVNALSCEITWFNLFPFNNQNMRVCIRSEKLHRSWHETTVILRGGCNDAYVQPSLFYFAVGIRFFFSLWCTWLSVKKVLNAPISTPFFFFFFSFAPCKWMKLGTVPNQLL